METLTRLYSRLREKLPFEFEGFSVTTILGIIPFPAAEFKRKRNRSKRARKRTIVPKPPEDPVTDTLENLRQDAIDEGDYVRAFGAAFFQNAYEKSKNKGQQS